MPHNIVGILKTSLVAWPETGPDAARAEVVGERLTRGFDLAALEQQADAQKLRPVEVEMVEQGIVGCAQRRG
jgi:hypothetical protein